MGTSFLFTLFCSVRLFSLLQNQGDHEGDSSEGLENIKTKITSEFGLQKGTQMK